MAEFREKLNGCVKNLEEFNGRVEGLPGLKVENMSIDVDDKTTKEPLGRIRSDPENYSKKTEDRLNDTKQPVIPLFYDDSETGTTPSEEEIGSPVSTARSSEVSEFDFMNKDSMPRPPMFGRKRPQHVPELNFSCWNDQWGPELNFFRFKDQLEDDSLDDGLDDYMACSPGTPPGMFSMTFPIGADGADSDASIQEEQPLESMTQAQLRSEAKKINITNEMIDETEDTDDTTKSLIELIKKTREEMELESMTQGQLKIELRKIGIPEKMILECDDTADTKKSFIELLIKKRRQNIMEMELEPMTQGQLKIELRKLGIPEKMISDCDDTADTKKSLIELLIKKRRQNIMEGMGGMPNGQRNVVMPMGAGALNNSDNDRMNPGPACETVAENLLERAHDKDSLLLDVQRASFLATRHAKDYNSAEKMLLDLQTDFQVTELMRHADFLLSETKEILETYSQCQLGWKRLHKEDQQIKFMNKRKSFLLRIWNSLCPAGQIRLTTLCLRNIPNNYTREDLCKILDRDFLGLYDFLYLPIHFEKNSNVGYAFVNFLHPDDANRCFDWFDGFEAWGKASEKVGDSGWADDQGLEANLEKYRNSPVMHKGVPDRFKPVCLNQNGTIVKGGIPAPTKRLRLPENFPDKLKVYRCSSCKEEMGKKSDSNKCANCNYEASWSQEVQYQ